MPIAKRKPLTIDNKPRPTAKPTPDLGKLLQEAVSYDMSEITLRISQYYPNLDPANFQCIAKFSDATKPWACTVDDSPEVALISTLAEVVTRGNPSMAIRVNATLKETKNVGTRLLHGAANGGKPAAAGHPRPKVKVPLRKPK
jgi:hypothetical protein